MSILINLLPDTRQVKQRGKQRRRLMTGLAIAVWVVCAGVLILLTLYMASQKLLITNDNNAIESSKTKLEGISGLTDALTAQQHLAALPGLYSQRAYFTKFFTAYSEANPQNVVLTSLTINADNTMVVNGTADTYTDAARLANALQAVNVTVGQGASQGNQPYFTDVAIQSATRSSNQVSFTLNATLASGVTSGN